MRLARETLRRHQVPSAEIVVALVSDAAIADLHKQYLGCDGPTDVLTFDLGDSEGRTGSGRRPVVGEIVISVDTAAGEARRRGHSLTAELALYLVHGTLHLLGYDDAASSDARTMHAMEDDILADAGFGRVYGTPGPQRAAGPIGPGAASPRRGAKRR